MERVGVGGEDEATTRRDPDTAPTGAEIGVGQEIGVTAAFSGWLLGGYAHKRAYLAAGMLN